MYYNRQKTVHLLPIPFDTAEIINSFLFNTIETITKKRKREVDYRFKNAIISRKNSYLFYEGDIDDLGYHQQPGDLGYPIQYPDIHILQFNFLARNADSCEHWAICLNHFSKYPKFPVEKQFQAINCKKCGNYKDSNKEIIDKIKCNCLL